MSMEETKATTAENTGSKADSKICGVCGDRALGYNFNAVTCESCKAFFRRNALKNKEFHCPFNETCEVTVITRRFCQRCRLAKCLAIGMRKDYIMSEEDKIMKRQKIEQNRARKRPSDSIGGSKLKKELNEDSNELSDADSNLSKCNGSTESSSSHLKQCKVWVGGIPPQPNFDDPERVQTVSPRASSSNVPYTLSHPHPSPTSAASMPSPSSPSDSASISGTKSIEVLSEQNNNRLGSVITSSTISNTLPPCQDIPHPFEENIAKYNTMPCQENRDLPLLSSLIKNQRNDVSPNYSVQSPSNILFTSQYKEETQMDFLEDEKLAKKDSYTVSDSNWNNIGGSRSGYATIDTAKEIIQDVQRISHAPNSIESILSEAIKLEFEAYSSLAKSHQNSRELNDAERAKLNELIVANKALHDPLDDDISDLVGDDCRFKRNADHSPVLLDVINLTAIAIRRLIKTSKKINAFKNMCQEDQVALLKGGCTEMLILRSAMTYDPDKNSWKIPHTQERLSVKVDVLKEANGKIYEEHQRFLRTFDPRWRTDENIMLILSAITLFTPDRPRVVHHDVIRLEQNAYYYLLRRYLESVYPGCEARSTFLKLIQKIAELHRLNDEHVRVYLDVNPRDVEPLLIEIFDLKPH